MQMLPLLTMGLMMANRPKSPAPPPTPEPAPVAPTRNDQRIRAAADARVRERSASMGRASTNLTGNAAPTAAPTFTNQVLGQ